MLLAVVTPMVFVVKKKIPKRNWTGRMDGRTDGRFIDFFLIVWECVAATINLNCCCFKGEWQSLLSRCLRSIGAKSKDRFKRHKFQTDRQTD